MSQSDSEQQLRIWKDLAISKQMLMNAAASALKLKDDFTADDLKEAIDIAVKRARDADNEIELGRQKAAQEIEDMQLTVKRTAKSRADSEAQREEALKEKELAEQALANGRKDNAEALKKAKRLVDDKQKELKAINLALADTPENIVKKLKALKKQKLDENNARKTAEEANRVLKKENKTQKEELDKLETLSENSAKLLEAYQQLREWSDGAAAKLGEAEVTIDEAPMVDTTVLAAIETATATPDEDEKKGKAKVAATA